MSCKFYVPLVEQAIGNTEFYKDLTSKFGDIPSLLTCLTRVINIEISKDEIKPNAEGNMTFSYNGRKRSEVKAETTFDAILNGERKATTRYESDGHIDYWKKLKIGDIVKFKDGKGRDVLVRITKPLTKLDENTSAEEWSKKEGWSVDYFNKEVTPKINQAYQMEYELVDDSFIITNFSEPFKDAYKKQFGTEIPDINTRDIVELSNLVDAALIYNDGQNINGNHTVIHNNTDSLTELYSNGNTTRTQGIRIAQGKLYDAYFNFKYRYSANQLEDLYGIRSSAKATKDIYRAETIRYFIDSLIDLINDDSITNDSVLDRTSDDEIDKFYSEYETEGFSPYVADALAVNKAKLEIIEDLIKDKKVNSKIVNTIVAIKEMLSLDDIKVNGETLRITDNYFNTVWNGSILSQLHVKDNYDQGDDIYEEDEDEYEELEITIDNSFKDYEDRLGKEYNSYLLHVSPEVNIYLNHLEDIDSSEVNDFGISYKMDRAKIASLLYVGIDSTSLDAMVESINKLAYEVPGFKGLKLLYQDLKASKDLAAKFYVSFAKYAMPSIQVMLDGSRIKYSTNEHNLNRYDALKFQYYADFRRKCINSRLELALPKKEEIRKARSKYNDNKSDKNKIDLINSLVSLFKDYIPSIDYANIANYIDKSGNETKAINDLITKTTELVSQAEILVKAVNENKAGILDRDILNTPNTNAKTIINELAAMLLPYSNPFMQLTVSNVLGKNHSALQNNNYLTRFITQLKSELNDNTDDSSPLLQLAKEMFQNKQYDFSNILLEHRDENGEIINQGIFRRRGDDIEYTEYAKDLLDVADFDGIYNAFGKALTYVKTSKEDYILAGYELFFNARNKEIKNGTLVPYMLKTPSDASHNYPIYAPVYKVDALNDKASIYNYDDYKETLNKRIKDLFKYVKVISPTDKNVAKQKMNISYDDFIQEYKNKSLTVFANNKVAISTDKVTKYQYLHLLVEENDIKLDVIVKGKYNEQDKTFTVFKANENLAIVKKPGEDNLQVAKNLIKSDIIGHRNIHIDDNDNWLQRTINKNHSLYKQLYQAFKQEMQNAASALILLSGRESGLVAESDINTYSKKLFKNYHYVGEVLKNHKLTGKVFTSDRFTLKDKNGNLINYMTKPFKINVNGQEVVYQVLDDTIISLDENGNPTKANPYSINFLYGGAEAHLHIENGEVIFTEEQQTAIDYALEQYINDYIQDTRDRLQNYRNSIHQTSINDDNYIAEYSLNYQLFYINTCDLFDGDSKFYKNTQDIFKRLKEVQAGGLSYALYDIKYERIADGANKKLHKSAYLNKEEVQNKLNSYIPKGETYDFKQYTSFVAATIENRIKTNGKENAIIRKRLIDALFGSGDFTEKTAEKRASEIMRGYVGTKTDDAQSYITLEEFVRRLAAKGQLVENMPLIQKLLDENAPINDKDLETFAQVQKNFYYDLHYDKNTQTVVPRQIKNAELILVPRFIKGTQLESLYNAMKSGGIDQINTEETSKAGKSQIVKVWTTKDTLRKNFDELGRELHDASSHYYYNYLYTQQENPQHMDDVNKAGVQVVKKIIDNIEDVDLNNPNISENKKNLYKAKQEFLKNFSSNIKGSFINVMNELLNDAKNNLKDGHLIINGEKVQGINYIQLVERLKQELLRVNADSNTLDYVTLIDNAFETVSSEGNFVGIITKMPTIFPAIKSRLESAAQAVFTNGITRQTLPGFHAAQVTSVGFAKQGSNKRLNYHISKDGFVHYIEVMVPPSAFGLSYDDPRYDGLTIEEKKEQILQEIHDACIDQFVGYRIPTEGKQSICLMKVVDLLDNAQGSTIVVPDGWVTQTGSDFDIDSVYTIMHEKFIDKSGLIHKYENKTENNRTRNNNIVDSLISILNNPLTIEEGLSQSKTTDFEIARDKLFEDSYIKRERENRSSFNVLDQAEFQSEGLQGKELKAISVNRDGFNSICNVAKPKFNKSINIIYKLTSAEYELAKKTFDDINDLGKGYYEISHNTWGWTKNNRNIEGALLLPYSSETTAHMLDAVKIGHIPNVNKETFKVYKTFLDIGSNFDMALAFIVQPAISRFINKLNAKDSIFSQDLTSPIKQTYIDIAKQLGLDTTGTKNRTKRLIYERLEDEINRIGNILNYDILAKRFKTNTPVKEESDLELAIDYLVLDKYEELDKIASEAESYSNVLRSDKFGAKASLYEAKQIFKDIEDILFKQSNVLTDEELNIVRENIENIEKVLNTTPEEDEKVKFTIKNLSNEKQEVIVTKEYAKLELELQLDFLFEYQNYIDDNNLFTVNGENLLLSVYPGVDKGLNSYIQESDDSKSVYPPLHYFLKYATATSIVVNKVLFPTEQNDFDGFVNNLASTLGIKKLSEELYNSYSNYILSNIFEKINSISLPIVYNKENGTFGVCEVKNGEDREKLKEYELQRIYGYKHILNEQYNTSDFVPKDIYNPTNEEIEIFSKFSPAEKVEWLNEHAEDSLVCKYLTSRTYIPAEYNEKYQACQTLRYNEDNIGIETVLDEFEKTFNNKNPFFVLTAIDLIKYSFVVEGYQTKRHSVNRIVKNSVLLNENSNYNLDIIEDLKREFGNFIAGIDSGKNDYLQERFIRSHSDIEEVTKKRLNKKEITKFINNNKVNVTDTDGKNYTTGVLKLQNNEENADFLKDIHNYFVLQGWINRENQSILYKVIRNENYSDVVYMYPLNKLQNNEDGDVSWNETNEKYASPSYYETIINNDYYQKGPMTVVDEKYLKPKDIIIKLTKEELEHPDIKKLDEILRNNNQDRFIYKLNNSNILVNKLKYDYNRKLTKILPYIQEDTNTLYHIREYKLGKDYYFLTPENIKSIASSAKSYFDVYRENINKESAIRNAIKDNKFYKNIRADLKKYAEDAAYVTVNSWTDDNLKIKGNFNNYKQKDEVNAAFGHLYTITKVKSNNSNIMESTAEDAYIYTSKKIKRKAKTTDIDVYKRMSKVLEDIGVNLHENDLNSSDDVKAKKTVERHLDEVASINKTVVKKVVEDIENRAKSFTRIGDDWISIDDPRIIDLLKKDPKLHSEYLTLLLDAQDLIDDYTSEPYDFRKVTSDNNNDFVKESIKDINSYVNELANSELLAKAEKLYVDNFLTSLSNDPNLKEGIGTLYDSYHATDFFTAGVNDLRDTHNPILQVITTTVNDRIMAADLQAVDEIKQFKSRYKNIINKAIAAGHPINFKNIIDEFGRLIRDYNSTFEKDLQDFRDSINSLKNELISIDEKCDVEPSNDNKYKRYKAGYAYCKKELEYRRWKIRNINQEVKDEFLNRKLELEENLFEKYPDIYVEYNFLEEKREALYQELNENDEDAKTQKLIEIEDAIKAITSPYDGVDYKKEYNEGHSIDYSSHEKAINDINAVYELRQVNEDIRLINNRIYTRDERDDFRENLDKNLQIIEVAEEPKFDAEGKPYIPSQKTLMKDEKYRKAKLWIHKNATYYYGKLYNEENLTDKELNKILIDFYTDKATMDYAERLAANPNMSEEEKDKLRKEYSIKVQAALNVFKNVDDRGRAKKKLYKHLAELRNAYDEYGVIDGTKFKDSDIDYIRRELENKFTRKEDSILSQETIIHHIPKDAKSTIYTREFYAGMISDGTKNEEWEPTVRELNSYLIHGIDDKGELHFDRLTEDDLKRILVILQNKFGFDARERGFGNANKTNKRIEASKESRKKIREFIDENVDFKWDQEAFDKEKANVAYKSENYQRLWNIIFQEERRIPGTNQYELVPNHLFYGYAKPKDEVMEQYVDKIKTAAIRILDKSFESNYTQYYINAKKEAEVKGVDYYNEWYKRNHVYNPNKHRFEPLPIWINSSPRIEQNPGEWKPSYNQTNRIVKDEAKNPYYKEGLSNLTNFKTKSQVNDIINNEPTKVFNIDFYQENKENYIPENKYFNTSHSMTKEESELKDLFYTTLVKLANGNKKALRYINEGWLPARNKAKERSFFDYKLWVDEFLKGLGFISGYTGREDWQKKPYYSDDYVPNIPMLNMLKSTESTKQSDIEQKPEREENETVEHYAQRLKEYREKREKQKANDLKIHKDMLDNNWESVFEEFISKAIHFNAVQENKNMLYFGQKLLNDFGTYESERKKEGFGQYLARRNGTYEKIKDEKLAKQYANWIRRIIFGQFKNPQGWRTKAVQVMQSLASTNYMTLNIRAGVSNVTVGGSNIIAEAFAEEYFDLKTWAKGKSIYARGIADYMSHMWEDVATTKVGAVIKGMYIVDYIDHTGQVVELSAEELSRRLRDLAFSPLSSGEHYMQNSGMISMMLSHRICKDENGNYKIMSKHEYDELVTLDVFKSLATPEEIAAYEKRKKEINEDKNLLKDYKQYRKNLLSEQLIKFDDARQKEFKKKRKEAIEARQSEFETNPTVWQQLDLGEDGKMKFADGSILKALHDKYIEDKKNGITKETISPAYLLLGKFKGRVIEVNKKIHGWYDKYSAAQIENGLVGGLLMQYHKHIVPGFLKRYRVNGYFNESRGTVEKGMYVSLIDFLKLNFQNVKAHRENNKTPGDDPNLTNEQKTLLEGLQNYFGYILDYVGYITQTYGILPDYEQANIKRNLGDLAAQVAAMLIALLVLLGFDDDDDDKFLPNFILYQADRLSSESWMWTPLGIKPEVQKLYSNPIAFSALPSDILAGLEVICGIMFGGEDYNPRFTTGRYAGRYKLGVYMERRIPYWRNIRSIMDISTNNKYYKLGGNPVGIVLKFKDDIRD